MSKHTDDDDVCFDFARKSDPQRQTKQAVQTRFREFRGLLYDSSNGEFRYNKKYTSYLLRVPPRDGDRPVLTRFRQRKASRQRSAHMEGDVREVRIH